MGVVGVPLEPSLGGGVAAPVSVFAKEQSYKAAILDAVGVLKGRRFSGGNRRGCRFRLFVLTPPLGFLSLIGSCSLSMFFLGRLCLSGLGSSGSRGDGRSAEVDMLFKLLTSAMLDLRAEKKGGWSYSVLGDS